MARKPPPGIATFDSAAAMARALARCLHGEGFPTVGKTGPVARYGHLVNRLPARLRELAYAAGGPLEAMPARRAGEVDAERIAEWIAGLYPHRRYPAVMIGSSNGALMHACAGMGIPWLPQTFLSLVRQRHPDPDDAAAAMEKGAPVARALLERNPDICAYHMHDPNQDRRMTPWVSYFRLKYLRLPRAYREFLSECLEPGGTVYVADCRSRWPVTCLSDRHLFQFGAAGGATKRDYFEGGERVADLFRRLGQQRRGWNPPAPDHEAPEAEWGFEPSLSGEIDGLTATRGLRTVRIAFDDPEDPGPAVADFFRAFYARHGIEVCRLIVPSFILHDPYWTMRTGSVPLWMVFNVRSSIPRIRDYLARAGPFEEIGLMLFSNGTDAVGQGSIDEWRSVLALARRRGYFLGVDESAYPRDFASMRQYHTALKALRPQVALPEPAPLAMFEDLMRRPDNAVAVEACRSPGIAAAGGRPGGK